jgi:hypothetical protein
LPLSTIRSVLTWINIFWNRSLSVNKFSSFGVSQSG